MAEIDINSNRFYRKINENNKRNLYLILNLFVKPERDRERVCGESIGDTRQTWQRNINIGQRRQKR
ncbi:MAG: hypothetical protein BAJATHORv1_20090 [Candidatus Thorarchaeota archaeon]|nr:MAG: hypothetical protein BAJATHORv1_20090 [Candidatus Thorarchaeota archaeon]